MARILSALCILPFLTLLVWYGSPFHFLLLMIGMIGLGMLEFYRMLEGNGLPCWKWTGILCGAFLSLAVYGGGEVSQAFVTGMIVLMFARGLFARDELLIAFQRAAYTLLGIFYVSWLLSHILRLRLLLEGESYVLYVFLVVWLGDAAALYVGSFIGRHKLAPEISPRKTVEGAVGGLLGSVAGALLGRLLLTEAFPLVHCLLLGGMLAVLGQLGDLSESLLKRSTGVKDSAQLIPGHGGILDKMDGMLFSAPAMYYYTLYMTRHGLAS